MFAVDFAIPARESIYRANRRVALVRKGVWHAVGPTRDSSDLQRTPGHFPFSRRTTHPV